MKKLLMFNTLEDGPAVVHVDSIDHVARRREGFPGKSKRGAPLDRTVITTDDGTMFFTSEAVADLYARIYGMDSAPDGTEPWRRPVPTGVHGADRTRDDLLHLVQLFGEALWSFEDFVDANDINMATARILREVISGTRWLAVEGTKLWAVLKDPREAQT